MGIPLLGLRTHFAYFPLAFLVPACFNCDGINRFFKALMLLALPVCTLAIYQSTQPATSWINIYGTGDAPNAMFGDDRLVRATGTFSYITGMGYFAQFAAATSFYLAMIANDGRRVGLAYLTFALALMACFATGSRAAIFGVVFQIILMILFSPPLRRRFVQRSLSNLVWVAIGCVGIYMAGALQLDAFLERTGEVSGDVGWRVSDLLTEWASVLAESPLGSGVGSGHQQAATFLGGEGGFGGYDSLPESELSRVAWELGILGFLAFGIFRIVSLLYGAMVVKQESKGANSILASFALSTMVPLVTSGIYSPMANALFWLSLGLFRLVRIQARPP